MITVTIESNTLNTQPWYKQFWPWFLISLPLSAVIAGITTIIIAMDKPDGLVVDEYYKEGLGINRQLAKEQIAVELGIKTRLVITQQQLSLKLSGKMPLPEKLMVSLVHPTQSEKDISWTLNKNNMSYYQTAISPLTSANWHIKIEPTEGNWRLSSRINPGQAEQFELNATK